MVLPSIVLLLAGAIADPALALYGVVSLIFAVTALLIEAALLTLLALWMARHAAWWCCDVFRRRGRRTCRRWFSGATG